MAPHVQLQPAEDDNNQVGLVLHGGFPRKGVSFLAVLIVRGSYHLGLHDGSLISKTPTKVLAHISGYLI